jgi:ceramide glucosyltransferase
MIVGFYFFAALLLLQGVVSLLEGFRYLDYVRRSLAAALPAYTPKACIIAPCKGLESGLQENLQALFRQDYPQYEIIFAVASAEDPALPVIEKAIQSHNPAQAIAIDPAGNSFPSENPKDWSAKPQAQLLIAGRDDRRSEKVNNLLTALDAVAEDTQVLVFVDSDARVSSDWLASLVAPLADARTGATTGYRWYMPESGGFFGALLSAWNGSVATTLGDHNRNFAWGGSTAILKKTFAQNQIREAWANALSDDYALTNMLQKNGQRIVFVPRCLTLSEEDATLRSLLEFTTRQVIITRVYNARLWWIGIISQVLFNSVFFGGLIFAGLNMAMGKAYPPMFVLLALIYLLGSAKGLLRMLAARLMLPRARREITKLWWMYCLLWILVSPLYLYNFLKSATTRRILWRGVLYELRSPQETVVIRQ